MKGATMPERHWLTVWDEDGPYGELCDCEIGEDHGEDDEEGDEE